jgi:hypothetical protein
MEPKKVPLPLLSKERQSSNSSVMFGRKVGNNKRVDSYMNVYGRSFDNGSKIRLRSSTPAPITAGTSIRSVNSTNLHNGTLRKIETREDTLKLLNKESTLKLRKIDEIVYEIQKAKSDLLEIRRDLATYDYNFLTERNLTEKLTSIQSSYSSLPTYSSSFKPSLDQDKLFSNSITSTFDSLFVPEVPIRCSHETSKSHEDYNIRKPALSNSSKILKKGVVKIDGEYYLISIQSRENQFHTTASLLSLNSTLITLKL